MARKRSLPTENQPSVSTDQIKANIIAVASAEFAERGFAGARIDTIAEQTLTSKRMIYYHFTDKDGLYRAVLTHAYSGIRAAEAQLQLDQMPPLTALRRLVETTFDYHADHPEFVRLIMDENIRLGVQIQKSSPTGTTSSAIARVRDLLERGRKSGEIRAGIDPVTLHLLISALSFYPVSNRHTL